MNRLLLALFASSIALTACSKKDEASAPAGSPSSAAPAMPAPAPAGPAAPQAMSATTPNVGKVLQILPAGAYTYAEVDTGNGQKVWIAGAPIQVKPGDSVQWGNYAVMQNFASKSLGRTFDQILFVDVWGPVGGNIAQVAPHGQMPGHPAAGAAEAPAGQGVAAGGGASQGEVKSVANAAGYTYVEVSQGGGTVWIAAPQTAVKPGDRVQWDGGMVMRNFNAKSLGRTFDEIVFASSVSVVR